MSVQHYCGGSMSEHHDLKEVYSHQLFKISNWLPLTPSSLVEHFILDRAVSQTGDEEEGEEVVEEEEYRGGGSLRGHGCLKG